MIPKKGELNYLSERPIELEPETVEAALACLQSDCMVDDSNFDSIKVKSDLTHFLRRDEITAKRFSIETFIKRWSLILKSKDLVIFKLFCDSFH